MTKPLKEKLSASKLKTLLACSLKYKYNYIDKVPQMPNMGNRIGDCVHIVCENLVKLRHYHIYEDLIISRDIKSSRVIDRFVKSYINKTKIPFEECYDKINKFIIVILENDFFCKPGELLGAEIDFDIISENPRYRVVGFMDQIAEYNDDWIRCKDFKTQKKEMEGKDKTDNIQHKIYSLACKEKYGWNKKVVVDFLMTNFEDNLWFRPPIASDLELIELEKYLAEMYYKIENFSGQDEWANVAARKPFAKKGEGFIGRTQCGKGEYKGQLKKDSNPYFSCPFKWGMEYYAIVENHVKIKTALEEKDLERSLKPGQELKKFVHAGCEYFLNKKY